MHPVLKTATEALAIYRDSASEEWERDYAAMMIGQLEEGRELLLATARDKNASEMLQHRAAECLARSRTADDRRCFRFHRCRVARSVVPAQRRIISPITTDLVARSADITVIRPRFLGS